MTTVELAQVTSDVLVNPYVYVDDWGIIRPRYTVFRVSVKNKTGSEVSFDFSKAALLDGDGEQFDAISYRDLRAKYAPVRNLERPPIYYYPPPSTYYYHPYPWYRRHPWRWYYHYDRYWGFRPFYYLPPIYDRSYIARAVISGTVLKPSKLYPGARKRGFIVFPRVAPDETDLKLILPVSAKGKGNVQFHFRRISGEK